MVVTSTTTTRIENPKNYTFDYPEDATKLRVDDDEDHRIGVITAMTTGAGKPTVERNFSDGGKIGESDDGIIGETATVTWATDVTENVTFTVQTADFTDADDEVDDDDWTDATGTEVNGASPEVIDVPEGQFAVRIMSVDNKGTSGDDTDDVTL